MYIRSGINYCRQKNVEGINYRSAIVCALCYVIDSIAETNTGSALGLGIGRVCSNQ